MRKTKKNNFIYSQARKEAAKFNDKFKSREGASEELGVSKDSLLNYELGLCKQVPVDIVCKMADIYNAPELLNHYCCNECPIGSIIAEPIRKDNINNIQKLSINIFQILDEGTAMGKSLLDIVEDGIIDESEKPQRDYIVSNLKKLSGLTTELILALEKLEVE